MVKYQITIFFKNDNFKCDNDDLKSKELYEYLVKFKGVFDTLTEGFDYIINRFGSILRQNGVKMEDLADAMNITRIHVLRCTKWNNMFLSELQPKEV